MEDIRLNLRPNISWRETTIYRHQAFHPTWWFGRTRVAAWAFYGVFTSLYQKIKKWLSIPTLRIWYPHTIDIMSLTTRAFAWLIIPCVCLLTYQQIIHPLHQALYLRKEQLFYIYFSVILTFSSKNQAYNCDKNNCKKTPANSRMFFLFFFVKIHVSFVIIWFLHYNIYVRHLTNG